MDKVSPSGGEDCRFESYLGQKHHRHFAALVLGHWDWSFLVMECLTSLPSSLMGGSAQIPWKRTSAGHPKSTLVHSQNHSCMQMLKEIVAASPGQYGSRLFVGSAYSSHGVVSPLCLWNADTEGHTGPLRRLSCSMHGKSPPAGLRDSNSDEVI